MPLSDPCAARESLLAILNDPQPGDALVKHIKTDNFKELTFLKDSAYIPAGPAPYHSGSVLKHLARCMNAVSGDPLAVWMAMCHDAGKLTTPKIMWPHHYGHEERGEILVRVWTKNLALPQSFHEAGALSSREHMRGPRYPGMKPGKSLKLLDAIFNSGYAAQLLRVMDADSRSHISLLLIDHWQKLHEIPADPDAQIRLLTKLKAGRRA